MFDLPTEFTIKEHEPYQPIKKDVVEKRYNAKFITELPLRTKHGGWTDFAAQIYYQETPPDPTFPNYFAMYVQLGTDDIMITGVKDFDPWVTALLTPENEVIYSSYRHDGFYDSTGKVMIDGGLDYTRTVGSAEDMQACTSIQLNVETGEIRLPVVEEDEEDEEDQE